MVTTTGKSVSQQSTSSCLTIGQLLVNCQSTVSQVTADSCLTDGRKLGSFFAGFDELGCQDDLHV